MRPFRFGSLLLFALAVSPSLSAQQTTSTSAGTTTSDPQAVALVQRALAVLTGGATVSDVTLSGTARRIAGSDDETGKATLKAISVGDSRVDLSFPSGNRTEIRNHSAVPLPGALPPGLPSSLAQTPQPVGAWSGPDGALKPVGENNIFADATWFFPAFTLSRVAASQNYVLSYVGEGTLNGQEALHVSAARPIPNAPTPVVNLMRHLTQMDIYLDPTTSLPVVLAFNNHPDNDALLDIPIEIQFSNYHPVNGVQVPFHVQKYLNGGLVLDLQLESVTVNSGTAMSSFQIP